MSQDDAWDKVKKGIESSEAEAAATAKFRTDFGLAIEHERYRRGWTAEEAARRAGMAPKTWQRLEDGKTVRNEQYLKVDKVFGLPDGTSLRCWHDQKSLQAALDENRAKQERELRLAEFSRPITSAGAAVAPAANAEGLGTVLPIVVDVDIAGPKDSSVTEVLTYILKNLSHVDLPKLRDMLSGVILAADRPLLAQQMETARREFQTYHSDSLRATEIYTRLVALSEEHPDDPELTEAVTVARETREYTIMREHEAAQKFFEAQMRYEEVEKMHVQLPTGFKIETRVNKEEGSGGAEHGEATER